ncbi:hypothetical protein [Micromonospora sp. ATA51]|uniref:hypothetical protein n=1 Tax=Micromonospora sp. ATA51 TaxID=2806098 RepID=UPI001A60CEAE|nr:hypothetical protein [Micromonospora sp. ATA51]MBM0228217.1 hypothetical protein [Micromonospora sp. ATA51]
MTLGMWLSLIGGVLELLAIGIATVSAALAYLKARARVAIIRESSERHRDDAEKAADYRRQRGVEPDMTWGDVQFVRTLITYAITRSAARSAVATVFFLTAGVVFSTAGNLLGTSP